MPGEARPASRAAPADPTATMTRAAQASQSRGTATIVARAVAVNANSGPFTGNGALTTHDGETGQWTARGTLVVGQIAGQLAVSVGGRQITVDLSQGRAYFEHRFSVLKGVAGRNRFQLRGRCDQTPFTGTVSGYFDGVGEVNGEFTGSMIWGKPAASSAADAVLPTGKLSCGYHERVGGVVAVDLGTREIRPSALGSLTLTPAEAYIARNGSGRFVREGASTIRLTSGPWTRAKATLQPDNSGAPAVYFELDDNRRADGTYIVDPWRTFCTLGGAR